MKHLVLTFLCLASAVVCHAQLATGTPHDVPNSAVAEPENLKPCEVEAQEHEPPFIEYGKNPSFPGGDVALMKYVQSHIDRSRIKAGSQGKVIVQFLVRKDGSIGEVTVARGVELSLDNEAKRIVESLPKFEPGMRNGEYVDVWYALPVVFK